MNYVDVKLPIKKFEPDEDKYPDRRRYSVLEAQYSKYGMITDNPDLCALPKALSTKKLINMSTIGLPEYSFEDTKDMTMADRKENVLMLQKAFSPLAHIVDMASAVNTALVTSYMGREVKIDASHTTIKSMPAQIDGRPNCFVVYGITGSGKTVAIKIIKSIYPEAIHHEIEDIEYIQIPIIMVTALVGNMTELMIGIAKKIDDIIGNGDVWERRVKKNNLGLSASVIKDAIRIYHIGLIIIDESQFLRFDSSNKSLENLIGIAEETGCSLGFIGNNELVRKIDNYPRLVSRTMYNRIEVKTTEEASQAFFLKAVKHLWTYQWTKKYTELTKEINDELVRASMYNICILKNLIMRIQSDAISKFPSNGITPDYIRRISETKFATIRTLIIDGSDESERLLYKYLEKNISSIQDDAKNLKAKANLKALEEQNSLDETWGIGRYDLLEKTVNSFGINAATLKKVITKLMLRDPCLPKQDISYVAESVIRYLEENKQDPTLTVRKSNKELDVETERLLQEAMRDSIAAITGSVEK